MVEMFSSIVMGLSTENNYPENNFLKTIKNDTKIPGSWAIINVMWQDL